MWQQILMTMCHKKLNNGVPNAKKWITRPKTLRTLPNSPHITLTQWPIQNHGLKIFESQPTPHYGQNSLYVLVLNVVSHFWSFWVIFDPWTQKTWFESKMHWLDFGFFRVHFSWQSNLGYIYRRIKISPKIFCISLDIFSVRCLHPQQRRFPHHLKYPFMGGGRWG